MKKARIFSNETRDEINCSFNPNEYTVTKKNTWQKMKILDEEVPTLEFKGGDSETLKMQLFFDTSLTGEDVRDQTKKLFKLMEISDSLTDRTSGKGRPPIVTFQWGVTRLFKAVITNITQKFTLFRENGVPVRATLDVDFLQAEDESYYRSQNPTTKGNAGHKRRVVKEGDTIDVIAFLEYNDSAMWRYIADINNLDNPGKLRPGQLLVIAPPQ